MKPDPSRPWMPVAFGDKDRGDIAALKALAAGNARPEQMTQAWNFILYRLCGLDDLEFRPDELGGERDSAFAAGKRFVGMQLRKIAALPMNLQAGEPK